MALKRKITKADYDKLAADLKTEYVADGDDNYRLDLDGEEDTGALKRAKDRETSSPRMWGCFRFQQHRRWIRYVFPTYVGVFP